MDVLTVKNLCKNYAKFKLDNVSFSLEQGKITGFIGRNGAGKTTTLKSLLNFIHPDNGEINFFGNNFKDNEFEIKKKIGFVSGGINYYPKKTLKTITAVNRKFYDTWDESAYRNYMTMFSLDESKTPSELSEGMKVKFSLTLALSHNAELLILDEPTSGLDPVSRDDLLDVFIQLAEEKNITIMFSTHITSDLDKCADNIIYIKKGKILREDSLDNFVSSYKIIKAHDDNAAEKIKSKLIGFKREKKGYSALIPSSEIPEGLNVEVENADLESIMIHMEKED